MWEGKVTAELVKLGQQYYKMFGMPPDCYDDVGYEVWSYDFFVKIIQESLETHRSIDLIFEDQKAYFEFCENFRNSNL